MRGFSAGADAFDAAGAAGAAGAAEARAPWEAALVCSGPVPVNPPGLRPPGPAPARAPAFGARPAARLG